MVRRILGPGNAVGLTVRALGIGYALVLAMGCASDEESDAISAEIHCETWVSREMGIPTGDLQFDHRETGTDSAPSYMVSGIVVGGGRTVAYQCDTTFDGEETWTLDDLIVTPG